LLSPTASGKSLILYLIMRKLVEDGKRGLIIVPNVSLVEQLHGDFEEYSEKNGWNVEDHVHKIYQGKDKVTKKAVTISTWQSIYQLNTPYFKQFDFVLGDECHLFKAKSLIEIMNKTVNAAYRIGTTGTLDGTKTHKLVLEGVFGPVSKSVTTKELIDCKQFADFSIKALLLKHSEETCKRMK
jgi:superfamily II DNA or RNA helicase